jgi:trans-AT polyketide synthase/acyltransferase/oxidoreductase domain-containing protein
MYQGIASEDVVIRMGRAWLLSFFGAGGLRIGRIEAAIKRIQGALGPDAPYGINFIHSPDHPEREEELVELLFRYQVTQIDAAAFMSITPSLVHYRARGLSQYPDGNINIGHRIMAKVSRPEVATAFLSPAPERFVQMLRDSGRITEEQARLSQEVPMCDDLCIESDSGGHTDKGILQTLMPVMLLLRDDIMQRYRYAKPVRVGAAGGLGTAQAVAAAFVLGADFVLTGSINQCTVESGTSDLVKDMLMDANIQDMDMAPAGDMFELGAKVQVLKKGVFFSVRANKLYALYSNHESWEEIDPKTRTQVEERYFKRTFDDIYREIKERYAASNPALIERVERNPKQKMAFVFRWYFIYSTDAALAGRKESKVDFQIHCGPALGAFNQWVKGTDVADWRKRHVDEIAWMLMDGAARHLQDYFAEVERPNLVRLDPRD